MKRLELTGLLEREGDGYVSLCPELDIASQGATMDARKDVLVELAQTDPSLYRRPLHLVVRMPNFPENLPCGTGARSYPLPA